MLKLTKLARHLECMHRMYSKCESNGIPCDKDNSPPSYIPKLPGSKYGGESLVTLLTGTTSIGLQGASYIKALFESVKVPVCFERMSVSSKVPDEFIMSVQRNRNAIHIDLQHDPTDKKKSLKLNNDLDLFACVVKMNSFQGYKCLFPDLDITLIFQNNTGDYSKLEYEPVPGLVETLRICQNKNIERFVRFAYEHAANNCRQKITFAHKSKELPLSDGMFIRIAKELHCEFKQIKIELMDINELMLELVTHPGRFDLICTSERYGAFVAATCSSVCGGASLFSACDVGKKHAVFRPLQTKLSISDCRELSPYGIVRACIDLLIELDNKQCALELWKQLINTMLIDRIKTKEFGGKDSGDFVICNIVNKLKCSFAA